MSLKEDDCTWSGALIGKSSCLETTLSWGWESRSHHFHTAALTQRLLRSSCGMKQIKKCCIFRTAFRCCEPQTLVEIVNCSVFSAKKLKKQEFCSKFLQKTGFLSLHPNGGRVLNILVWLVISTRLH